MTIQVLVKTHYKNCDLYVRHFGYVFEYLFTHKKKLYQGHFIIKPVWYRRLLPTHYTPRQLQLVVSQVLSTAHKHIDKLKSHPSGAIPPKGR